MATTENPTPAPSRGALLHQITDLLTQTEPDAPTAVGIAFDGDEIELALKPLARGDVVDALAGFTAPPEWAAFALVAPATAHHLDRVTSQPAFLGVLAARDGTTASALRGSTVELQVRAAGSSEAGDGRVLDACRRVLGLSTAAPVHAPQLWAAHHWADAVLAAVLAADLGARPSWPELAVLDPGVTARNLTWCTLRGRCAAGALRIPSLSPRAAAWMDDGMFSREALAGYPPLPSMVADLRELLPPEHHRALLLRLCDGLEHATAAVVPR
jgi:hypothetical protein